MLARIAGLFVPSGLSVRCLSSHRAAHSPEQESAYDSRICYYLLKASWHRAHAVAAASQRGACRRSPQLMAARAPLGCAAQHFPGTVPMDVTWSHPRCNDKVLGAART